MYWFHYLDGYVDLDKAISIQIKFNNYGKIFVVAVFSLNSEDECITLKDFTNEKDAKQFLEDLMDKVDAKKRD